MPRPNLRPHHVHSHATSLLLRTPSTTTSNQPALPPPWYTPLSHTPPSAPLTRPPLHRSTRRPGKKSSRIFSPVNLSYHEDRLRWEYFNDHPWELARPRIVLEEDGRDRERWDWGLPLDYALRRPMSGSEAERWDQVWGKQCGRPVNGEAVIQRQLHLLRTTSLSPSAAYDKSRKELYRLRHAREIETRVAREEAQSTGAFFGPGPLEIGMELEDKAYEDWKAWAIKETVALKQVQGAAYTGAEAEEAESSGTAEGGEEGGGAELEVREIAEKVPGSRRGLEAKGGDAVHP